MLASFVELVPGPLGLMLAFGPTSPFLLLFFLLLIWRRIL
jgi:hypothetical protein